MVMVDSIVVIIIHVRIAASRARRVLVRPTANMNIQGGMKFRLKGPHSRLKERHEGKERKKNERGQKARRRKKGTAAGPLARFHVWGIGVDVCGCVRTCIVNKWIFLVNGHVATVVGETTLSMATTQ